MTAFLIVYLGVSLASTEGDAVLVEIDKQNKVETAQMTLDLKVLRPNGAESNRTLEIWQSETDARLVRLTAPSRLKGIGLLVKGSEQIHMFLPQYPPSRRVLGSSRADSFMGTDFAIDDLARLSFADNYTADIKEHRKDGMELSLIPKDKEGQKSTLIIDAQNRVLIQKHFTSKGELDRQIEMQDYRLINGVWLAHQLTVSDQKNHRKTIAQLQQVVVNEAIPSETFTLNTLENP